MHNAGMPVGLMYNEGEKDAVAPPPQRPEPPLHLAAEGCDLMTRGTIEAATEVCSQAFGSYC
jgi:hypothetical protein